MKRQEIYRAACDPLNAIDWALDHGPGGETRIFLADWRMGDFGDWPEYITWAAGRAKPALDAEEGG